MLADKVNILTHTHTQPLHQIHTKCGTEKDIQGVSSLRRKEEMHNLYMPQCSSNASKAQKIQGQFWPVGEAISTY